MQGFSRRKFLSRTSVGLAAAASGGAALGAAERQPIEPTQSAGVENKAPDVDFRYAPQHWETAICLPDDPHKNLVGERGELRMSGKPALVPGMFYADQVEFTLATMDQQPKITQRIESPAVPIIHTELAWPKVLVRLTTFSSNRQDEGRVDNVIMEIVPREGESLMAAPVVILRAKNPVKHTKGDGIVQFEVDVEPRRLLAVASGSLSRLRDTGIGAYLSFKAVEARRDQPARLVMRFPLGGQTAEQLAAGLTDPAALLAEMREFWTKQRPSAGNVGWKLSGRSDEFLTACARNIMQAREVKNGKLTFQVGATCYRGLWVVDGHFLLEAGKYLGYDADVQQGLETTWAMQREDGAVLAGGGAEHWKDTGIAMFSLVRQAELSQDWSYFRRMQPQVLRGVKFLQSLCEKAKAEGGDMGRYGLLARGFCDGGVRDLRDEFTNTLWALAGLKAVVEAADRLGIDGYGETKAFYRTLNDACSQAMRQEMRDDPGGFQFLPMVMNSDPQWNATNAWDRLRPQGAQWALSHAIFPGRLFNPNDPVVRGHIALMKACTKEDVPTETGWIPHEGLWGYNAAFVAHVYLWAGDVDAARRTFAGFLNHASPLYCWREEQPLRGSFVAEYVGDMPHNWASAMCILYLRHRLALENGDELRLLPGIGGPELQDGRPMAIENSPTRFGRISMKLEPLGDGGWALDFRREKGPAPRKLVLPNSLAPRCRFAELQGAEVTRAGDAINVDPAKLAWRAVWRQQ